MTDPYVHIVTTGGTIANPPDIDGYLSGEQLLEGVEEIHDVAECDVTEVSSRASSAMSPQVWFDLRQAIEESLDRDPSPDGIVVTHGSNTTEETAYFLNLTLDTDVPVALTAAQRNFGTIGNDGNRNLLDAVRVVSDPEAAGRGVLVVVNDEAHYARDVRKEVSGRPDAWTSGEFGPLGWIDKEGLVQFYRTPDQRHTTRSAFTETTFEAFPDIEVIYTAAGSTAGAIEAAVDRDVDGLVVAAFPTGSVARAEEIRGQDIGLETAIENDIPVVISHRGMEGWPQQSLIDDDELIWGNTLRPQHARVLLGVGLQKTTDVEQLQQYFLEY